MTKPLLSPYRIADNEYSDTVYYLSYTELFTTKTRSSNKRVGISCAIAHILKCNGLRDMKLINHKSHLP